MTNEIASRWSGPEKRRAEIVAGYVVDSRFAHVAPAELARRIRRDNLAHFASVPRRDIEAHIVVARMTLLRMAGERNAHDAGQNHSTQ